MYIISNTKQHTNQAAYFVIFSCELVVDGGKVRVGDSLLTVPGVPPTKTQPNTSNDPCSVTVTVAGDGTFRPTLVTYKGKDPNQALEHEFAILTAKKFQGSILTETDTGYNDAATYQRYLREILIDSQWKPAEEMGLYLMDGCGSHLAKDCLTSDFLRELLDHGWLVVSLPANTTHLLQVNDVHLFSMLKLAMMRRREQWVEERGSEVITKKDAICSIFFGAMADLAKGHTIVKSFKKAGIPVSSNPEIVPQVCLRSCPVCVHCVVNYSAPPHRLRVAARCQDIPQKLFPPPPRPLPPYSTLVESQTRTCSTTPSCTKR